MVVAASPSEQGEQRDETIGVAMGGHEGEDLLWAERQGVRVFV